MDVVFPDAGLLYLLRQAVGSGLIYDLFINDLRPTVSSQLSDFTRANWSSYAPINVPLSAWTMAIISAHVGGLQAPDITFFNNSIAPVLVYGYFVKDSTNSILVAAARFDLAPLTVLVGGGQVVTPLLGSYSGLGS